MEVGKVPLKQKTPQKQGFVGLEEGDFANPHRLGIAVYHEIDPRRETKP
jgi:hypothetical protein